MTSYVLGYDLDRPDQNYPELFSAIKALGVTWWHNLDSTWIIKSTLSADAIGKKLSRHIGSSDKLFVGALSGEGAWVGFVAKPDSWLMANL